MTAKLHAAQIVSHHQLNCILRHLSSSNCSTSIMSRQTYTVQKNRAHVREEKKKKHKREEWFRKLRVSVINIFRLVKSFADESAANGNGSILPCAYRITLSLFILPPPRIFVYACCDLDIPLISLTNGVFATRFFFSRFQNVVMKINFILWYWFIDVGIYWKMVVCFRWDKRSSTWLKVDQKAFKVPTYFHELKHKKKIPPSILRVYLNRANLKWS